MTTEEKTADYSGYAEWKGWVGDGESTSTFVLEPEFATVPSGARILEIGFGTAEILDWFKARGVTTEGVELIPALTDAAAVRGHTVRIGAAPADLRPLDGAYDMVIALDVLEHLTTQEIVDTLAEAARLLRPGGVFVARFPNGGSPFGRHIQYGDLTHVSVLGTGAVKRLVAESPLTLVAVRNAARPVHGKRSAIVKWLAYRVRDLFESVVGRAYLGSRVPMDPNLTLVARRA